MNMDAAPALSDKIALVTGGGQGLGEAAGRALHGAGATVLINYFPDAASANRAKAEALAEALGERAAALEADVRDPASLDRMAEKIKGCWGRLDVLVNNAGILRDRSFAKMTPGEWQSVIETNLNGVFYTTHALLPLLQPGGRIINLSSIAAFLGFFGQANYASAKAGVVALTKVLARELGRKGINVNAVAPGVVLTDMGKSIPEQARLEMLKQIPAGRFGEPEEIAAVILFLAGPAASYVNGQTIHVNGGWYG